MGMSHTAVKCGLHETRSSGSPDKRTRSGTRQDPVIAARCSRAILGHNHHLALVTKRHSPRYGSGSTQMHVIASIKGGNKIPPTQPTLLERFLAPTSGECPIPHEKEVESSLKPVASRGNGKFLKDAVASAGAMFPDMQRLVLFPLMINFKVTDPLTAGPSTSPGSDQDTQFGRTS